MHIKCCLSVGKDEPEDEDEGKRHITKTRVSLKSFINRTIQFIYPNGAYGDDCYSCTISAASVHAAPADNNAASIV